MVAADHPRRATTRNQSPDVPFEQSVNPCQGCEHGCIYCFARPSHACWNLGPGLEFETRLFHKPALADVLERELSSPHYACKPINLGANTDPYQPIEAEYRTTRRLLEVLLAGLAEQRLVSVMVSLTTLDDELKRALEPRAASPRARLRVIRELAAAGVPVGVLLAPMIPALNDHEIESLLEAAAARGGPLRAARFGPVRHGLSQVRLRGRP